MLGREIGTGLITLSRKIFVGDDMGRNEMALAIDEWQLTERSLAIANGKDDLVDSIDDKADCLRAVLENAETAKDVRDELRDLFSKEAGPRTTTLSSIHKAKGLEWDNVLFLDPWRLPSRRAREKARTSGDDTDLKQEMNLKYVAETRTKNVLVLASLDDFTALGEATARQKKLAEALAKGGELPDTSGLMRILGAD
jgi:superfamily I DNA/RNA helicase